MAFSKDVIVTDAIEIETTPERVYSFLTGIVDDQSYRAWHRTDHVCFRWLRGAPWTEGAVMLAEEYIHGKLHKFRFRVTRVVPNRYIEYTPVSRWLRHFFPRNAFNIELRGDRCLFVASGTFRPGWIGRAFFQQSVAKGLASLKKHMREEGESLKRLLEGC